MSRSSPAEEIVTVTALASSGEGVAMHAGRRMFVPGTMPGDTVEVRRRGGEHAELVRIVEPASDRVVPPCPIVARCGGCAWQHVPSVLQRDAHLDRVRRALPRTLRDQRIDYVPSPLSYGYRVRARLAWQTTGARVVLGFRERRSHTIRDVPACAVLDGHLDRALPILREQLAALPGTGELSLALGRDRRPVVTLRAERSPDVRGFRVPHALVTSGFAGASLHPPGASVPTVEGDPRPVVTGGDGVPLYLAPEGFSQANDAMNPLLARAVADAAALDGARLLELYAGAGNFTVLLARRSAQVTAVEADRAAAVALEENLRFRSLDNVTIRAEDAARVALGHANVVVLDPPRSGAPEVARALVSSRVKRVVYVSCDPATLGRDLRTLTERFACTSLTAFEMFPQTAHVETLAVLDRPM